MKCEDFEKEVLISNGNLGKEAMRHWAECKNCRMFEKLAFHARTCGKQGAPEELRQLIVAQKPVAKHHWRWVVRVGAVAALLILCALFWLLPGGGQPGSKAGVENGAAVSEYSFDMESLAIYEQETSWRQNVYAIDSELDSMELNVELIACGL